MDGLDTDARADAAGATPQPGPGPGEPPQIRRVPVFITISLALMMMAIDSTIVATALDALQTGLDTSINWAGWTITAYSFGFVLMLPVSGKLSERYGRRRVFLGSVLTFTVASLCCGLATNIYMLIVLRALQAAGGAGFTPSATGIVVDYFGDARDRAVSLFGSIFPVGAMIGPIFGGLFVTYWSWRGVFFVNLPIGLAIVVMTLRYVPRDAALTHTKLGADVSGIVSLAVGVLTGMLAASYMGETGSHVGSPAFWLPLVVAALALAWFFRHIARSSHPFIAPHLVYGRNFGAVNLFNAIFGGMTLGAIALLPLYAVNRYGLSPLAAGTLLTAQGIATVALTLSAALALRRTGHRPPLYFGAVVMVIGLTLLALRPFGALSPYAWLAVATFVVGAGFGTVNPASRNAGLQLEPEHASTLAALRTMSLQIGSIVTVSIATAIIATAHDPATAQALFYVAIAIFMLLCLPIITRVPEHHGAW